MTSPSCADPPWSSQIILEPLHHYIAIWHLTPDGVSLETPQSWLLPVQHAGAPAILKVRTPSSDETLTAAMLDYYAGLGAVRAIKSDGDAVLMERARGTRSLWAMATGGEDDAAAEILAGLVACLHAPRDRAPPEGLTTLPEWFSNLFKRRDQLPIFAIAAAVTDTLLATPLEPCVLHGDLHHNNVVFDTARGWLAIDPKGLWGERAYDVANLLRNPQHHPSIVHAAGRMQRHTNLYASRLNLDPGRILRFALAHAALSAAWCMDDGLNPEFCLQTAEIAACLGE